MSSRGVIAVDIDEVLAGFLPACNEWHNRVYGTDLKTSDYQSYFFKDTWKVSEEETLRRVYTFFESEEFRNIKVIPGALEGILALRDAGFDLYAVTSRQFKIREETFRWINTHFGSTTFRDILFGNHWVAADDPTKSKRIPKSELLKQINAVAFIDDQPGYCIDASKVVDKVILFNLNGGYGWCEISRGELEELGIKEVRTWPEILRMLLSESSSTGGGGEAAATTRSTAVNLLKVDVPSTS